MLGEAAPTEVLNLPASQGVHAAAPAVAPYDPAAQSLHTKSTRAATAVDAPVLPKNTMGAKGVEGPCCATRGRYTSAPGCLPL